MAYPVAVFDDPAAVAAIAGDEVELHVGAVVGAGEGRLGEAARFDVVGGQHPLPEAEIAQRRGGDPGRVLQRQAKRPARGRAGGDHPVDMVAQVLADAGQVVRHLAALGFQRVAGADAAGHQQRGRAEGAGGQDHLGRAGQGALGAVLDDDQPGDGLALHHQPAAFRALQDGQVRAVFGGFQEGAVGAEARALVLGDVVDAGAKLVGAIEIVVLGQAGGCRGLDEGV